MQYVEAPTDLYDMEYRWPHPWVFVAGGITNCPPWQWELAEMLEDYDRGTLFQPRRENFPIDDPSAAEKQIRWECTALHECDVFSMWFCNSESVQPICMFELGTHTARHMCSDKPFALAIGVEPGYSREQDVRIQTELMGVDIPIATSLREHANNIRFHCGNYTGEKLGFLHV